MEKDLVRAWKDPMTRESGALAASHPVGLIELADEELRAAIGVALTPPQTTAPTCTMETFRGWRACCP
jgi:mersacidin/lichenicidin family type 2 lantibiotic